MPYRSDCYALFPSRAGIDDVQQWLSGLALREAWSPRQQFGLALCLEEALCNVIEHAFDKHCGNNLVLICVSSQPAAIVVELRDNARPADPTSETPATLARNLEEARPGGHGLRLMRHFLTELRYQRDGNWNCLTMTAGERCA